MTLQEKRSYLEEIAVRGKLFGEEVAYVDGIGYTFTNNKLIIVDIQDSVIEDGKLIIDEAYNRISIDEDKSFSDKLKKELTYVDLGNITSIETNGLFENCENLRTVKMSKMKSVPDCSFKFCHNLEEVYAPSLVKVGIEAFYGCKKLNNLVTGVLSNLETNAFREVPLNRLKGKNLKLAFNSLLGLDYLTHIEVEKLSGDLYNLIMLNSLEYLDIGLIKKTNKFYSFYNVIEHEAYKSSLYQLIKDERVRLKYIHEDLEMARKFNKKGYCFPDILRIIEGCYNLKELHLSLDSAFSKKESEYIKTRFDLLTLKGVKVVYR